MLNIAGIVSVVLSYLVVLAVGIWAGRKKSDAGNGEDEIMLAGRNIGLVVGIFTATATWVSGGSINGAAEAIYTSGLLWCQAPFGYAASLFVGAIFFAKPMRRKGYVTMIDPLQDAFGKKMGGLLFLPALCGEIFWAAGILAALGATLSVIVGMDQTASVIMSSCVAIFYTLFGGLYSVAYTDVIQLICIFVGLWLCVPFAWMNDKVKPLSDQKIDWVGSIKYEELGFYIDGFLLLVFGGIPWQVYFQRVLSSKSPSQAQLLSSISAVGCLIMAVPPIIIGAIAKATPWNETNYDGPYPLTPAEASHVLPLVMQYLTPEWVSLFGLGAVSAAVMSSVDSSFLSASSMFARNIYKVIFRQQASEFEIILVMKLTIFSVGALATFMALTVSSVYGLWSLCSDLVYCILFPQLVMVVHFKEHCNAYGSLVAYLVTFVIRVSGGEPVLGIPALVHFPGWDGQKQLFPFKTMSMLISFVTLITVSWLSNYLFKNGYVKPKYDYLRCIVNVSKDKQSCDKNATELTLAVNAVKKNDDCG